MIEQLKIGQLPLPIKSENNIPVVMTSSEAFLPYTCVTLFSLLENGNSDFFYDVILLSQQEYSPVGQNLLARTTARYKNCTIRLINVSHYLSDNLHAEGHISTETYARLLLPKLMKYYTDVLYLDSDLVVCHDVSELLKPAPPDIMLSGIVDIDVFGQYYGPELSMRYYLKRKLRLPGPDYYLQAGVLIFHIPAIRNILGEDTLARAGEKCRLRYFDQDVLNCLCSGHIQRLDMQWNVVSDCDGFRLANIIIHSPAWLYDAYMNARKEPWIIHFSGHQKPWNDAQMDFGDYFYQTARRAGLTEATPDIHGTKDKSTLLKKVAKKLLPKQSWRRELLKIWYFSYKYRAVARERGTNS